ncbi:hypothetical protein [Acinetobacter baumannii]|uniref:hypothetical protein n=1 Tax=Acinetobacter baumannii TaxID=470 RepID=UPI00066EB60A|nr:hypothetical protein [Acinetobacter baumannii]
MAEGDFTFLKFPAKIRDGFPELEYIKQSIRLSSSDQIRNDDVSTYAEIITDISASIILVDLPHYSKELKKYLPTALKLQDRRAESDIR